MYILVEHEDIRLKVTGDGKSLDTKALRILNQLGEGKSVDWVISNNEGVSEYVVTKFVFKFECGGEETRGLPFDVSPRGLKHNGKRPIRLDIYGDITPHVESNLHQIMHPHSTKEDIHLHGSIREEGKYE